MEYRKDIQGLRAIAVLFVFIFHLNESWLPGGFIGVDIFFVVSGFLISSIILSKLDNKSFSFIEFYKSRIKRIVPAYYFLLIVVAIIGLFIILSTDIYTFRKSLFWSTVFNSNYYFSTLDTYFGAKSSENPFLHTWTLAIEMQFYLFLPLLLFFTKRKWLFKLILFLTIILFTYSSIEILINNNKNSMYFSLLARIPEFFIGVLTAILIKEGKVFKKNKVIPSILGLCLLVVSAIFINENSPFPGVLSIIPCIGTAFLIIAPPNPIRNFLSGKALVFIGEISYSLYLWHWPIMAYFRYYYSTEIFSFPQIIIIILLSFILSIFSYYFIETTLRKKKGYTFSLKLSLLIGLNILVIFLFIPISKNRNTLPLEFISPVVGLDSHGNTFKKVEVFGDTLSPTNKIFFFGDSHALSMKPYLDYMGRNNSFSFRTVTNDRYPPIPMLDKDVFSDLRFYNQYLNLMEYVEKELNDNDIIILQCAGGGRWEKSIENMSTNLKPHQYLIILSDFPSLGKNPVKINRGIIRNDERDNIYNIKRPYPSKEFIEKINSTQSCYFLDLTNSEAFKTIPFCNDTLMYYDDGHLNKFGAQVYAKHTETVFMNLLDSLISE
jgi:peptidoglycan/LPS O-acetylase OafA/YrhL